MRDFFFSLGCRPMVPAIGKGTPVTLLQVKPGTVLNTMNASPAQSCSISSSMSDILNMSADDSSDDSSDNAMETHNSQQPYPRLRLSCKLLFIRIGEYYIASVPFL